VLQAHPATPRLRASLANLLLPCPPAPAAAPRPQVHPATLRLRASLANLRLLDGSLAEDNPNRMMVTMREDGSGSLIEVVFK
jgi:hypothetical protein